MCYPCVSLSKNSTMASPDSDSDCNDRMEIDFGGSNDEDKHIDITVCD